MSGRGTISVQMEGELEGLNRDWEQREVAGEGTQVGEGRSKLWRGEKGCVGERPSGGQVDRLWRDQDEARGSRGVREGFLEEVAHRLRPIG